MRAKEFILTPIAEAAMNPTVFAQAIQQGAEQGVLVGFEFEVGVPAAVFIKQVAGKNPMAAKVKRNWNEFVRGLDLSSAEEAASFDSIFKFKQPINGYTSIGDFIAKRQAELLPKAREAFEAIPEQIRAKFISKARERVEDKVRWWSTKLPPNSPAMQLMFANVLGSFIYSNTSGKVSEAGYKLRNIGNSGVDLDGDIILYSIYKRTVTDRLINTFLANLEYDPSAAWDVMKDDIYDEEDDDDEQYDRAAPKLAAALKATVGMPVQVFNEYHEDDKKLDRWYIEPDGSLEVSTPGDATAEIVSPPLPALRAMEDLKKFYALASQLGLYSNHSTGLHINVSIPGNLDVLKLAVFLGDKYVLQQYDREDSGYARSVGKQLEPGALGSQTKLMNKMHDTNAVDTTMLKKVIGDFAAQHTASISYNGKYVSFRHAGGNYLGDFNKVYNTVGRFIRAMIIASTEGAYEREYQTELAKYGIAAQSQRGLQSKTKIVAADAMIKYVRANGIPTSTVVGLLDPNFTVAELKKWIKQYLYIITTNSAVYNRPATEEDRQIVLSRIQQPDNKAMASQEGWHPVAFTVVPTNAAEIKKFAALTPANSVSKAGHMGFWTTVKGNMPANDPRAQAILKAALRTRYKGK